MRDLAREIYESVRRNKLRTALAGLSVSWGIFMLIVLLGAGNGLLNAFMGGSEDISANTMGVYPGFTSIPYDGLESGREMTLDEKDIDLTKSEFFKDHVDEVSATLSQSSLTISNGDKYLSATATGVQESYASMNKIQILAGRFINKADIEQQRKVLVINAKDARTLFGDSTEPKEAVGRRVMMGGFSYRIIGVRKTDEMTMSGEVFMPYSTIKTIFAKGKNIDELNFTFHGLKTEADNEAFEKEYRAALNQAHRAAPEDDRSFWIWNQFTEEMQMNKATSLLKIALWVIGIFTLLSGIVGVSNIMLITVKERTHEFGIRKAIGAGPGSIATLIIAESVTITATFGYIGMFIGMVLCESLEGLVSKLSTVSIMGETVTLLKDPTVGLDVAIGATVLLIVAGTLAGLSPALKAARVRPIEALNSTR